MIVTFKILKNQNLIITILEEPKVQLIFFLFIIVLINVNDQFMIKIVNLETEGEKETIKAYAHKAGQGEESVKYEADFEVPNDFGEIGAVLVENEHHKEMFLETILLDGFPEGPIHFDCYSWVHSKFDSPTKRVFFTNNVRTIYNYNYRSLTN